MPISCSAYNCTNRFHKGSGISFHRFPKNENRRKLWIYAVHRGQWNPSPRTYLCSKHFNPGCFYISHGRQILKPEAIPTIFNFPSELQSKMIASIVSKINNESHNHISNESSKANGSCLEPTTIFNEHCYAVFNPKEKLELLVQKNQKLQHQLKMAYQYVKRHELLLQEKDNIIIDLHRRLKKEETNEIINLCLREVSKTERSLSNHLFDLDENEVSSDIIFNECDITDAKERVEFFAQENQKLQEKLKMVYQNISKKKLLLKKKIDIILDLQEILREEENRGPVLRKKESQNYHLYDIVIKNIAK